MVEHVKDIDGIQRPKRTVYKASQWERTFSKRYYSIGNQGSLDCGSYYIDFFVSRYKLAHFR